MHGEIFVANESLQQLRNLRKVIEDMVIFGEARNKFVKELIALEKKQELEKVQMEQLKLIMSIKIQKLILTLPHLSKFTMSTINSTYNKVIDILEEIEGKLHISEKVLHLKIIQTLLDYKICQKFAIQHNFYFQELLPILEKHNQFQKIFTKKDQEYEMYFLGLLIEFIQKEDMQSFVQIYTLTINYIKQKLDRLKKELKSITHELVIKQLLVLLHLHLSYKLIKKHLKFNEQQTSENIYVLLYDLDYSITEALTIDYKRYYNKTQNQAVNFVISKMKSFIIDVQNGLNFDNQLLETRKLERTSNFKIKRTSGSLNELRKRISSEKIKSLNKIESKNIKIKNNMFIPQKVNINKKLQHKIQFKVHKNHLKIATHQNQSDISIKSIKNIEQKQIIKYDEGQIKMGYTISKNEIESPLKSTPNQAYNNSNKQHLSYSHCIKQIVSANQELQFKICQRPQDALNHINFESKNSQNLRESKIIARKNRSKRSNTLHRKISVNFNTPNNAQEKSEVIRDFHKNSQGSLYVPPPIKKALYRYFKSLLILSSYESMRKEIPFYKELTNLNPSKYYYLYSNIYKVISFSQRNLVVSITFLLNNKAWINVRIDLKQINHQSQIKDQLAVQDKKSQIIDFYFLGKDIMLFRLNLKIPDKEEIFIKHTIKQIKYQYQVYSYNVYLNTARITKSLIKKVLKKQETLMDKINKQLDIDFNYNTKDRLEKTVQQSRLDSNLMKFYEYFSQSSIKYDHNLYLLQKSKKSLKFKKSFEVFTIKIYKCMEREKYYLVLQTSNLSRIVVSCKKISIQTLFHNVRTIKMLKNTIIRQNKMIFDCWNDVLMNKNILQPQTKKYCIRAANGHRMIYSKIIIQGQMKLIYGHEKETRWFLLVSLLQIQPVWLKFLPNSRHKLKSTKNMKNSKKQIKSYDAGQELCLVQHLKNAKINLPFIVLNKEQYHLLTYQHHWIYNYNQRLHYCFKNQKKITYFTIFKKELIYVNSMKLSNAQTRDQIFAEFKNEIQLNQKRLKLPIVQYGQIAKINCDKHTFSCILESEEVLYEMKIDKSEVMLFDQQMEITKKLLRNRTFQNRLIKIIKQRIHEMCYTNF